MEEIEVWKPVLNYNGYYLASNLGSIKSLKNNKEKLLVIRTNNRGYSYVILCKDGKCKKHMVNRLVWESFNGATDLQVDHKEEGNKLNNKLSNLQTLTCRQNASKHRLTKNKTSQYTGVSWSKPLSKWRTDIRINKKNIFLGYFTDELEAANAYQNALKSL